MMVVHLVFQISTCRRRNHVFIKSFTTSTFVFQSILFVMHFWPRNSKQADIMVVLLLSRYVDNHGHLWSRDFKLTNKCVYSLILLFLLKLLHQIGNTPTQQLEIPCYQAELEKTSLPSSPREYLDQIGNEGSHSTYFFILKQRKPQQWQNIKGCKRHKRNTHSRQIRVLKQNTTTTLQKPSQFWYPFSVKNKG